eukprot:CAMPEP_0185568722 /NCGR_PEP_ID=MMETSP0434-20130131/1594_1 /TAXON_ID=626734 ORGANISM="Favella taraikaensis, Strain Fe Narragansett Bay" /NCGR_SAMPLE_ID=MMETSP0434 /ASSEMBLY_ACC=CAM_ASM_000379 /LENGTH=375 /DNA_ID=CAMNT_0028183317 /DNA_START=61 /DNA_END=1188 /DNA_ORIENTATION=+
MRAALIAILGVLVPIASASLRATAAGARDLQTAPTCVRGFRLRGDYLEGDECNKAAVIADLEERRDDSGSRRAAQWQTCIDEVTSGIIDVDAECAAAREAVSLEDALKQSDSKSDFTESDITEFFKGDTYWNTNTGPLECDALLIPDVRNHAARKETIANPFTCTDPIMMCVWVRDRQPRDNNGDCATPLHENCVNKGPGDNTDLCIVADDDEGNIHAHGLVYHPDTEEAEYAGNMLFFVSMFDHMYQRGYVENVDYGGDHVYPMCDCIENLPKVSRSDCTEISINRDNFDLRYRPSSGLTVNRNLRLQFDTCDGEDEDGNGPGEANDLYSEIVAVYGGEDNVPSYIDQDNDEATDQLVGACKAGDVAVSGPALS